MHYIVCVHVCIKHLWNFVHNRNVSWWDSLCVLVFKFVSVTCRHRIQGATVISQVAKTLGSTSTWHRLDTFASDQCLIDVEQRVCAIWDSMTVIWVWEWLPDDDRFNEKNHARLSPEKEQTSAKERTSRTFLDIKILNFGRIFVD